MALSLAPIVPTVVCRLPAVLVGVLGLGRGWSLVVRLGFQARRRRAPLLALELLEHPLHDLVRQSDAVHRLPSGGATARGAVLLKCHRGEASEREQTGRIAGQQSRARRRVGYRLTGAGSGNSERLSRVTGGGRIDMGDTRYDQIPDGLTQDQRGPAVRTVLGVRPGRDAAPLALQALVAAPVGVHGVDHRPTVNSPEMQGLPSALLLDRRSVC